eukprot:5071911-Prymnesium_polylepis.1
MKLQVAPRAGRTLDARVSTARTRSCCAAWALPAPLPAAQRVERMHAHRYQRPRIPPDIA